MTRDRGPTWPASSRIGESRADFNARVARDGWPGACTDHLVIDCPDCPDDRPGPETAAALTCPDCGGSDFELRLGGRDSGQIRCTGCGLRFEPIRDDES